MGAEWVQQGPDRVYRGVMAHIQKRENPSGAVVYRVRWRQDGTYQSETFGTHAAAVQFRGLVDAAGQQYPPDWRPGAGFVEPEPPDEVPTLAQWAERAIATRSRANDRTRADYRRQIARHLPPELADAPIDALTREQMGAWIIGLGATLEPKSIRNLHGLMSSILSDAVDAGLIPRNPVRGLVTSLPSARKADPVFLTPAEFAALLDVTPEHWRPLVQFFARTGARFGEAIALDVEQVDLARAVVRIDRAVKRGAAGTFYVGSTKSRRSRRSVAIDETLVDVLRPLVEGRHDGCVFTTPDGHRVAHSNFTNRVWYPILDAAEPVIHKRPRVHDLRHTHASWLIAAGVSLPAIQSRLGHESITTTIDLYGHLMPDADRDATAALGRLLG
jgi:integrase